MAITYHEHRHPIRIPLWCGYLHVYHYMDKDAANANRIWKILELLNNFDIEVGSQNYTSFRFSSDVVSIFDSVVYK